MHPIHDELKAIILGLPPQLRALPNIDSPAGVAEDTWSPKQLLGHLIDSAANNHQRFVRAAISGTIQFPAYAQEAWVETQAYADADWSSLIDLWTSYNTHLLHVIDHLPADTYQHRCQVGEDGPVTLDFLIRDYVAHIRHHLADLVPNGQW
jgi:hypothetical protein